MFTQIVTMVLPVLVMIALGRVCAVTGILNDEQHTGIKNIIGNILLPVVLFQAFFTADYGLRMLLVFVLVFAGYGIALAAGYALRKLVQPYDRFMPLLLTSSEGGMLGYALFGLLCGADQTKTYAMVDIGQTMFAYTVFLTALKAAGGEKMTPKFIAKTMLTNKACMGMLLGILLGALGASGAGRNGGRRHSGIAAGLHHCPHLRPDSDCHWLPAPRQQGAAAPGADHHGLASGGTGSHLRCHLRHSVFRHPL